MTGPVTPPTPVHPHARGEHLDVQGGHLAEFGSSPRPWGTPGWRCRHRARSRFIPTPVGNTGAICCSVSAAPVHPHARGEHVIGLMVVTQTRGSSPRPWGTLVQDLIARTHHRFIPTPVGNTRMNSENPRLDSVHPHARGEHLGVSPAVTVRAGSSPRPWGTLTGQGLGGWKPRFIPTPVGNTGSRHHPGCSGSVHPHARGEHSRRYRAFSALAGSSPRPWGTLASRAAFNSSTRFIPTPVGNTWASVPPSCTPPVHPHARGEHDYIKDAWAK